MLEAKIQSTLFVEAERLISCLPLRKSLRTSSAAGVSSYIRVRRSYYSVCHSEKGTQCSLHTVGVRKGESWSERVYCAGEGWGKYYHLSAMGLTTLLRFLAPTNLKWIGKLEIIPKNTVIGESAPSTCGYNENSFIQKHAYHEQASWYSRFDWYTVSETKT